MIGRLEHLSSKDGLRELGLFSREKRRLWEHLRAPSSTLRKLGTDFVAGCAGIGQGRMLNWKGIDLD